MKIDQTEIKKILCIKPRGIGDIILSTIILENQRSAFTKAEIHYLTEEFAKRAVENNPFVSKILTYKKSNSIFSIIQKIRREKYDLVLANIQKQEMTKKDVDMHITSKVNLVR